MFQKPVLEIFETSPIELETVRILSSKSIDVGQVQSVSPQKFRVLINVESNKLTN